MTTGRQRGMALVPLTQLKHGGSTALIGAIFRPCSPKHRRNTTLAHTVGGLVQGL